MISTKEEDLWSVEVKALILDAKGINAGNKSAKFRKSGKANSRIRF